VYTRRLERARKFQLAGLQLVGLQLVEDDGAPAAVHAKLPDGERVGLPAVLGAGIDVDNGLGEGKHFADDGLALCVVSFKERG
jgi:hypothetical protein